MNKKGIEEILLPDEVEDGKMNTKQTTTKPVIEKSNDPSQSNT